MSWLAASVFAGAACGARAPVASPEVVPTPAPKVAPTPAPRPASAREPVPLVVLERPEGLDVLDVAEAASLWGEVPVLEPTPPDDPPAPRVPRPLSGGEAMALADLALARGDAFDAVAQYRALLPALEPHAVTYAELQLARAHAARGELEIADELLRRLVKGTGPEAWAALVELAKLRARDVGAREALRELGAYARGRSEELADHLIVGGSDAEAASLLIDKAARMQRCGYAFEAVRRWPDVLAEDVMAIGPLAEQAGRRALVERVARAALDIAAEVALARAPSDVQLLPRIRAAANQLRHGDRDAVHRHINVLVQTYGVR